MINQVPVGIVLPYRVGNDGFFKQTYSDLDRARINLAFLLQTAKGERPMMPTYGSELHEILFEPNMELHADDLFEDAVREAASTWMPEITIMAVRVVRDNVNYSNHATLKIEFRVNNIPDSDQQIAISIGGPSGSAD
jgi:phage baseplate assembly protein W